MGTDTGRNLLNPGDNPHDNEQFLFFATAVIQAVNKHQGLLRASVASAGQDHRLGANEAPPAIISIFLGAELDKVFDALAKGKGGETTPGTVLGLGTPVLPPLPMDGGDRDRTRPFAFTGNKFEFRALGSSMSPSFPNTVLNTIVAEAIDDLADKLEAAAKGKSVDAVLAGVLGKAFKANSKIVFGGDNYDEAWHTEATTKRGLTNLRTSPDAFPEVIAKDTIAVFSRYGVLNSREIESRYEVWVEQYITTVNIEAETAASIARTMLLPAALRHLAQLKAAGVLELTRETDALVKKFVVAIKALEKVNASHPHGDALKHAIYMRDKVLSAMAAVRTVADQLEKVVADDLWPLPKYAEILFIK
jgi:glutamine synthetase